MAIIGFGHIGMSSRKFRSHSASSPALSKAMTSNSMVDRAIHVCLEDLHDIVALPKVNIYQLVDLDSKLSEIQLTSLNPSITDRYLV